MGDRPQRDRAVSEPRRILSDLPYIVVEEELVPDTGGQVAASAVRVRAIVVEHLVISFSKTGAKRFFYTGPSTAGYAMLKNLYTGRAGVLSPLVFPSYILRIQHRNRF